MTSYWETKKIRLRDNKGSNIYTSCMYCDEALFGMTKEEFDRKFK